MIYDYIVLGGYFTLIIAIAFVFQRMASNSTSDYFRGGGKMLWWMVGSSAFMAQISAFTFTGGSGKAFTDGFAMSLVFFANTFAFICGWLFFAKRFRQMRVDTPTEGIKRRFGADNELFFSWAIIIFSIINGGVWLNALGVFASSFLNADIGITIIVTGLAILFVSVLSGAWGVVASDFIQTLVLFVISIACAIVALIKVGGPVNLVTEFPSNFFTGPDMNYGLLLVGSFIFFMGKQLVTMMNLNDSYRFLTAKDSKEASKAALFAAIIMGIGSILFFIPPWATAILYPDAAAMNAELGSKAADAVFLVFAQNAMPAGAVGLLLAGMFAATMSSMDSALNKASGIFVRSVYQPYLVKKQRSASDKNLLRIGMVVSAISAAMVILSALYFASMKDSSLFEVMMMMSSLVQVPLLVPLLYGQFLRRTPSWAPWATVIVGAFVSLMMKNVFTPEFFANAMGIAEFTAREAGDMAIMTTIAAHLFVTGGFFIATTLFYSEANDKNRESTDAFFEDMERPVIADGDVQDEYDRQQRNKLGTMVMAMGAGMFAMVLIPNPASGRFIFVACAIAVLAIGALLKRSAKPASIENLRGE